MHVEGLLPANLCLPVVTLINSEQHLQFERFQLQLIQTVNKTSSFTNNKIDWQYCL